MSRPRAVNAPDRIWLNVGDLEEDSEFAEIERSFDVTWCAERIEDSDIEYVRRWGNENRDQLEDALDHIMRVARTSTSPTGRMDWIAIRAKYALEGKKWSADIRETPRDGVKELQRHIRKLKAKIAELETKCEAV